MSLEIYAIAADLYLARGQDVNSSRPAFTGDVFGDVPIPGVQDGGMAIVVAHPCTMRGPQARMRERVLVAAVRAHSPIGREAWARGYYDLMPLPELINGNLHVGRFDELGKALTVDLTTGKRVACLSEYGVNLLQQRLIWHLTLLEVETFRIQEAFAHTFEEADLLEEWTDTLSAGGLSPADAAASFEAFIRVDHENGRTLQEDLRDVQRRSAVRVACRNEARRLSAAST